MALFSISTNFVVFFEEVLKNLLSPTFLYPIGIGWWVVRLNLEIFILDQPFFDMRSYVGFSLT